MSKTYSYDANGNQTGSTDGNTLSYNAHDQTTSTTPYSGAAIPATYTGSGQSERVSQGSGSKLLAQGLHRMLR